jgi:hypothetical protein
MRMASGQAQRSTASPRRVSSSSDGYLRHFGEFLRVLMSVPGVFESLFAEFMSGQMIRLAVSDSGGGMSVGCKIVQFRGSVVGALGHVVLLRCSMQTVRTRFETSNPTHLYAPALRSQVEFHRREADLPCLGVVIQKKRLALAPVDKHGHHQHIPIHARRRNHMGLDGPIFVI